MIRELVTRPISAVVALIELPTTVRRSLTQANDLMEQSRRQLEAMQAQTDEALRQAERMNDLLGRVVKLTEPIEIAQRGSEYVGGRLKRALFGEDTSAEHASRAEYAVDDRAAAAPVGADGDLRKTADRIERAAEDAEVAATEAEVAATEAEDAAEHAEEEAEEGVGEEAGDGGIEITESGTVRVIPNRPPPGESAPER